MTNQDARTDLGLIKIHKNAVASISSLAAMEVEGVKRIGSDFTGKFFAFFGKNIPHSIKVSFDKNDEVKIDIPLIIKYGYNIPEVSSKVQENIRTALDKMSNLTIRDININVRGIERAVS
ncbi:MAG: Asp23/Gls24 family envelope stress response protein [Candidatus Omnitrophica bacterium]|nr:Asp23/Gls24 family envelope stress response protein [Candidatus Omnitrophota bacterium]